MIIGGVPVKMSNSIDDTGVITIQDFLDALQLLQGEPPMLLGAPKALLAGHLLTWLQVNHPITAVVQLPAEILCNQYSWFLAGHTVVAMSIAKMN